MLTTLPDPQTACEAVMVLIAAGHRTAAWEALQQLAQAHPLHAPIYRLQGGILQQTEQWELALGCFQQALALDANDSQTHTGAARCLHTLGRLPEALMHFREAVRCQCEQPKQVPAPPPPPPFDYQAAEATLWKVLAQLAAAGVQAFPTSGTLLGLVREGHLLPFDKDLDIALPFEQMEAAAACLQAAGWRRKIHMQGLVNPQEWQGEGIALDLCGYLPDPQSGNNIGGFWFQHPDHPWSRITEVSELKLRKADTPYGEVWQLDNPEAILLPLYGPDWRVPDPDFDTVVAACSLRGFTLVTQCYAFARLYSTWVLGRLDKARSLVRHTLRHLPDDELLQVAARVLGLPPERRESAS